MNHTRITLFVCLIIAQLTLSAQNQNANLSDKSKLKAKAKKLMNKGKYFEARDIYTQLVQIDSTDFNNNFELGYLYSTATADSSEKAILPFERAIKYAGKKPKTLSYYFLAYTYLKNENYDKAIENFKNFLPSAKKGKQGKLLKAEVENAIKQAELAKEKLSKTNESDIKNQNELLSYFDDSEESYVKIENIGRRINSKFGDYNTIIEPKSGLMFFITRRDGARNSYDDKNVEKTYFVLRKGENLTKPEKYITPGTNPKSKIHYVLVMFTWDGNEVILYRKQKLFISKKNQNNEWGKPKKIASPINKFRTYQPSAVLSPDGKYMVFTSERNGNLGGLDLYISERIGENKFSPAINLGENVNTIFNEDAPYFSPDGNYLYFSSKGHDGLGGYDFFKSEFKNGQVSKAVNLGLPFNSSGDDLYLFMNANGKEAFFASDRKGGYGDMDIYRINYLKSQPEFENCKIVDGEERQDIFKNIPLEVNAGNELTIKLETETFRNYQIKNVNWMFNDLVLSSGNVAKIPFENKGEQKLRIELFLYNSSTFNYDKQCFETSILVK